MLALIFRGFFLLGILSWYSTSLWRMIDSYFKDQFQRYLEEEYQRNPKMREDLHVHTTVDKSDKPSIDVKKKYDQFLKECIGDICSIGQTDLELGPTDILEAGDDEVRQEKEEKEEKEKERLAPFRKKCDEDGDAKPPDKRNESPTIMKK
jgi:hypothetical protein